MASRGIDRAPQLAMYRQGFAAGRDAERRQWLDAGRETSVRLWLDVSQEVLLNRVIRILADAMQERERNAVLTGRTVGICKRRAAAGEPIRALAREYGVSHNAMWKAVRGVTWKHLAKEQL